jgi:hypothetical protein
LLHEHSQAQEVALWAAVVALEESAVLVEHTASHFSHAIAEKLRRQAILKRKQAEQFRQILQELEPFEA